MNKHPIHARLTHQYSAGWSHLDRFEYIATLKLTPPTLQKRYDDGDTNHIMYGRLSAKQREQARKVWEELPRLGRLKFKHWLQGAISSTFETGCRCEHDCCGHYQTYAVADLYGRRVVVTVHNYRNL